MNHVIDFFCLDIEQVSLELVAQPHLKFVIFKVNTSGTLRQIPRPPSTKPYYDTCTIDSSISMRLLSILRVNADLQIKDNMNWLRKSERFLSSVEVDTTKENICLLGTLWKKVRPALKAWLLISHIESCIYRVHLLIAHENSVTGLKEQLAHIIIK